MPNEHMCCAGWGKVADEAWDQAQEIAKRHGYRFVYTNAVGNGPRSWFAGPNLGSPFDRAFREAIEADVEAVPGLSEALGWR